MVTVIPSIPRLTLRFNSNLGRVVTIGIPRALVGKSAADTQTAMNALIGNSALYVTGRGRPVSIKDAELSQGERVIYPV